MYTPIKTGNAQVDMNMDVIAREIARLEKAVAELKATADKLERSIGVIGNKI